MIIAPKSRETPVRAPLPPTFSIVIPVYQGAWCIAEAIRSVLEQDPPAHEIIVCDDGSTDELDAALAPFDGRITVLSQEHRGVSAARNHGLFHATGEFVAVCDSDDWYLPGLIDAWTKLAVERPDIDILGRTSYLIQEGKWLGVSRTPTSPPFDIDDQRLSILRADFIGGCSAFRRRCLVDLGGYDESIPVGEDYDSFVRMVLAGSRAALNFEPLAVIRLREDSHSRQGLPALEGLVATFSKVLQRTDLSEAERSATSDRLHEFTLALDLFLAKAAVAQGLPEARSRCLKVARASDQPAASRVKAALSAVAPSLAARVGRSGR